MIAANGHIDLLPHGWRWTREWTNPDGIRLYFARCDSWGADVPDIVATSVRDVVRYAHDCSEAEHNAEVQS